MAAPALKFQKLPEGLIDWKELIDRFNFARSKLFGQIGRRKDYLWNWVFTAAKTTQMRSPKKSLDPSLDEIANTAKTIGVMWDVFMDDIADEYLPTERAELMLDVAFNKASNKRLSANEQAYLRECENCHKLVFELARKLPGYKRHALALRREYMQIRKCFSYSLETRQNFQAIDFTKYVQIMSNNMHMIANGVIDLMKLDYKETFFDNPLLRKMFVFGQRMGRIGNATTTYEYEIERGDYTSEIFALAISLGLLDSDSFEDPKRVLASVYNADLEAVLWTFWKGYRFQLMELAPSLPSLDIKSYVAGLEKLRLLHLGSRGKK
ncbi:MAG: hypothetical protein HYW48_06750 [Deltaproteobacteria bacterium]|nr:hypothetical protein [Deltaproteobacteria bacterium]